MLSPSTGANRRSDAIAGSVGMLKGCLLMVLPLDILLQVSSVGLQKGRLQGDGVAAFHPEREPADGGGVGSDGVADGQPREAVPSGRWDVGSDRCAQS